MNVDELLLQLADIQAPSPPGWWLLAPGSLFLLTVLAIFIIVFWACRQRRRTNSLRDSAKRELQRIKSLHPTQLSNRQLALALSHWLRQVSLIAYPEKRIGGLTGTAWLAFLDHCVGDKRFSQGSGQVFGDAIYRQHLSLDVASLYPLCDQWLVAVTPRLRQQGRARC